ncbi:hypothetical protein NHX12_024862 [Muraenolepis orangiensis]|uniref:Granulins domain-containing protein n=1 Tax=Muraenolepis orangiensis TaxID=630683 RepID=A0A9Q0ISQ8_9TELE|nr:hypothetical protein NHX12_024862 [Muraenolepis orangiensis]
MVGLVLLVLLGVSSASPCPDGRSCEGSDASCCTSPPAHVKAVKCPDQESECPDETTCCQLPDQTWGCCQMPNAVCCEDQRHCCPEGSRCDLSHSRCVSPGGGSVAMLENRPARRRPGGKSSCPEGTTCCLLTSGDYGCCPYAEAVCCNDHIHCCPAESMCDLKHERCLSGDQVFPLATKTSARPNDCEYCPLSPQKPAASSHSEQLLPLVPLWKSNSKGLFSSLAS